MIGSLAAHFLSRKCLWTEIFIDIYKSFCCISTETLHESTVRCTNNFARQLLPVEIKRHDRSSWTEQVCMRSHGTAMCQTEYNGTHELGVNLFLYLMVFLQKKSSCYFFNISLRCFVVTFCWVSLTFHWSSTSISQSPKQLNPFSGAKYVGTRSHGATMCQTECNVHMKQLMVHFYTYIYKHFYTSLTFHWSSTNTSHSPKNCSRCRMYHTD